MRSFLSDCLWMGITLAIFSWLGIIPVDKDLLIIIVCGSIILLIDSLISLVEMLSWPELCHELLSKDPVWNMFIICEVNGKHTA